jgi:hypothetical protein
LDAAIRLFQSFPKPALCGTDTRSITIAEELAFQGYRHRQFPVVGGERNSGQNGHKKSLDNLPRCATLADVEFGAKIRFSPSLDLGQFGVAQLEEPLPSARDFQVN